MYEAPMSDEVMYVLKCGIVILAWIIGGAMVALFESSTGTKI
jgi:hypothetical protein